ncbi:MAG: branched-chain amino acid ABC transporter permease [Armatimonadaceae bacterium]
MSFDQFFQQIINGIQLGSIYALIALGYTMVYGVLKLINFAHGDVFMIGAYMGFYAAIFQDQWAKKAGVPLLQYSEKSNLAESLIALLPAILFGMIVCALLGWAIERIAYRPLRRAPRLTSLITAIGVSLFLANGAQLIFSSRVRFIPSVVPAGVEGTFQLGEVFISKKLLILVVASALLMGILWYIVQNTRLGKAMRAVSHDTDAAALMGINTDGIISFTFILGAALAGAGGVLFGALTSAKIFPLLGLQMGLKAFVAAVVGGIGSIPGAMLGGILMGLSEAFVKGAAPIGAFEPSRWADAVAFFLLIIVLLVRPAGLLGKFVPEKV